MRGFTNLLNLLGDLVRDLRQGSLHGVAVFFLAFVFAWSGIVKIRSPKLAALAMADFGVIRTVKRGFGTALGVVELLAGVCFPVCAALGGAIVGIALGEAGRYVPSGSRAGIATLLAVAGLVIGMTEVLGHRVRPLECSRETPRRWVSQGSVAWASKNGLTLGSGMASRVGFWMWYAVPAGALLFASPRLGAVLYGTYGLTRGLGPWGSCSSLATGRAGRRRRGWIASISREPSPLAASWC